jgi:FkbM family methyltransferase
MSPNKRLTSYFNFILLAFSFILVMTIIRYKLYYDNYYDQLNADNHIYLKIKLNEFKSKRLNLNNRNQISSNETIKNVFIDLGTNKGNSIYDFFGLLEKSQSSNLNGQNLFENEGEDSFILKTWDIYAFEANEFYSDQLNEMKNMIESLGHNVYLYDKTAACTFNGFIDFYLDKKSKYFNYKSLEKNHRDFIKSNFKKSKVKCVDIAEILKKYQLSDIIIIKMDIEGFEYDLLQDFIVKDVSKIIDFMVVEFHDFVSPFKSSNDVIKSLYALQGVKIMN